MSSDLGSQTPEFLEDTETVGRTWADVLYKGRKALAVLIIVVIAVAYVLVAQPDLSGVAEIILRYIDAITAFFVAFIVFLIIGLILVRRLLDVATVDYLVLDFVDFTGAIYRIPANLVSQFEISGGNNLQFTWRDGHSFKLARSVDLENGVIDTAWPHQVPIEQAAFTLSDLQRREEDYEVAKLENLLLRRRPVVVATELARTSNTKLAEEISDVLELDRLDIRSYLEGLDPLRPSRRQTEDSEDSDEEDDADVDAA